MSRPRMNAYRSGWYDWDDQEQRRKAEREFDEDADAKARRRRARRRAPEFQPWPQQGRRRRKGQTPRWRRDEARADGAGGSQRDAEARRHHEQTAPRRDGGRRR